MQMGCVRLEVTTLPPYLWVHIPMIHSGKWEEQRWLEGGAKEAIEWSGRGLRERHMEISREHTEGYGKIYSLYWKILVWVELCDHNNNNSNNNNSMQIKSEGKAPTMLHKVNITEAASNG